MSPDLGFCACEPAVDGPGRVNVRVRISPLCFVHYWMYAENDQPCPDCGGLCRVVAMWKGAS